MSCKLSQFPVPSAPICFAPLLILGLHKAKRYVQIQAGIDICSLQYHFHILKSLFITLSCCLEQCFLYNSLAYWNLHSVKAVRNSLSQYINCLCFLIYIIQKLLCRISKNRAVLFSLKSNITRPRRGCVMTVRVVFFIRFLLQKYHLMMSPVYHLKECIILLSSLFYISTKFP